jgi:hypothetical protein
LLVTSLSAYSIGTSETFVLQQLVEGFNASDFGWGTASAQTVTLSFWVRSSLTGTFGGCFANSAHDRAYPFTYTISAANTWEQKTIAVAGDTSGTWIGGTNGIGIRVYFNLGSGSTVSSTAGAWTSGFFVSATGATSVVGTNGATFYITGVQFEKGSTATSFDYRPYGTELQLAQRYFIAVGGDTANQNFTPMSAYSTTAFNGGAVGFPVKMRTNPTFSYSALSDFYVQTAIGGALTPTALTQNAAEASTYCGAIKGTVASGLVAGNSSYLFAQTTSARLNFSAEL